HRKRDKRYFQIMKRLALALGFALIPLYTQAVTLDANKLVQHVSVSFSPRQGSFTDDSTFDVPVIVNTQGTTINGVELSILFDKNRLQVVKPLSGTSIIGVWVEPPGYDNTKGTASYVGVIPDGIRTNSGLIGTITFKAKGTGRATLTFAATTKVLL